jgi:hypothetical protein
MSSLNKSTCDKFGDDGGKRASVSTSNNKECTSCEQKVDNHCKPSDSNSGDCNSDIDTVAEGIARVYISNDDNNMGNSTVDIDDIINEVESIAISDEKLFADPPPKEDCPICMLPMPFATGICGVRTTYHPCCGKTICEGCVLAAQIEMHKGNLKELCSFCRVPCLRNSNKELMKRFEKRTKLNDANAFRRLGDAYDIGEWDLPENRKKALELWTKAAELGSLDAHYELACAYHDGQGVEFDMDKAIHHFTLAAIRGDEFARNNLGAIEEANDNINHAMKHYIIGARCGNGDSLKKVGVGYKSGYVTKDDYASTLRAYQVSLDEMKSEQRMSYNPGKVRQFDGHYCLVCQR